MFEELGLNVARQPDNGANPRPDNRSGWLEGETPDVIAQARARAAPEQSAEAEAALEIHLWDPASQLRFQHKRTVPQRPDGAANTGSGVRTRRR
jgi:biotin synthase